MLQQCCMLQIFHEQAQEVGAGRRSPRVRGKRSGQGSKRMRIVAAGGAGPMGTAAAARGQAQHRRAGRQANGKELHATLHTSDRAREPCSLQTCKITRESGGPAAAELIDGTKPKGRAVGAVVRTRLARRTSALTKPYVFFFFSPRFRPFFPL